MGNDTIRDGVPAKNGIVGNVNSGNPKLPFVPYLKPGLVYADGIRGVVSAGRKDITPGDGLVLLEVQTDLPDTVKIPDKGKHVVYADIWHRTVHPLEDPRLTEVALHGAETAFRQKTMAQLKTAPADAVDSITNGAGSFPRIGTGILSVSPLENQDTGNDCDPCAAEIPLESRVANALFRIEVVAIKGTANAPSEVTLAWSAENAAETAPVDALPDGFEDGTYAFEHSTVKIEQHKGIFADPSIQLTSEFSDSVITTDKTRFVRRWDGCCTYTIGGTAGATTGSGEGRITGDGKLQINTSSFSAAIDPGGKRVMIGDYWLVELRTNAPQDETVDDRFHKVSSTPLGIEHHYAILFHVEDGKPVPLSDSEERALTFPVISDLPATHVSFRNNCRDKFENAENVQEALDALCGLDAEKLPFDNTCPELYKDAKTVQAALSNLCNYDFGKNADRTWMKYIFDWGVVCGLKITRLDSKTVQVSTGAYLDWQGNFVISDWKASRKIEIEKIRFDPDAMKEKQPFGLGIEVRDGQTALVIAPKEKFTLKGDETLIEKLEACRKIDKGMFFDKTYESLDDFDKFAFGSVVGMAISGVWRTGATRLSTDEYRSVESTVNKLEAAYADAHSAPQAEAMQARMRAAEAAYPTDGLVGLALDEQRGKQMAAKTNILVKGSQELVNACKCWNIWPDCLDRSQAPVTVPLAEVYVSFQDNGQLTAINHVCMVAFRRQALTPRTLHYYLREMIENQIVIRMVGESPKTSKVSDLAQLCCAPTDADKPAPGGVVVPDKDWELLPWDPGDLVVTGPGRGDPDRWHFDLEGKTPEAAADILTGNGVMLDGTLDLRGDDARGKLAELIGKDGLDARLNSREMAGPGDKVMLLVEDDEVAGYIVVERGAGKYTYTPTSETKASALSPGSGSGEPGKDVGVGGVGGVDLSALDKALKDIESRAGTLDERLDGMAAPGGKIGGLQDSLDGLSAGLDKTGQTLQELEAEHTALTERLKTQLDQILDTGLGAHEAELTGLLDRLAENRGRIETTHAALAEKIEDSAKAVGALEPRVDTLATRIDAARDLAEGNRFDDLTAGLDGLAARYDKLAEGMDKTYGPLLTEYEKRVSDLGNGAKQIGADLPELEKRVGDLSGDFEALRKDLTDVLAERIAADTAHARALDDQKAQSERLSAMLSAGVDGGTVQLDTLDGRRKALTAALSKSDKTLRDLETARAAKMQTAHAALQELMKEIGKQQDEIKEAEADLARKTTQARDELSALGKEKTALISAMRAERPVSALAVVADNKFQGTLQKFGLFTVGDIAAVRAAKLREIEADDPDLASSLRSDIKKIARDYMKG